MLITIPYLLVHILFMSPRSDVALENVALDKVDLKTHWVVLVISLWLTSMTLMFLGGYGKLRHRKRNSGEKKSLGIAGDTQRGSKIGLDLGSAQSIIGRTTAVLLPIWSAFEFGGTKLASILLVLAASGVVPLDNPFLSGATFKNWKKLALGRNGTVTWLLLSLLSGTFFIGKLRPFVGSVTLMLWLLASRSPFRASTPPIDSAMSPPPSAKSTSAVPATPVEDPLSADAKSFITPISPLIRTDRDIDLSLVSGISLGVLAMLMSITNQPALSVKLLLKLFLCAALMSISLIFSQPSRLRTNIKGGFLLGIGVIIIASSLLGLSQRFILSEAGLCLLGYICVQYDDKMPNQATAPSHKHAHHHKHHSAQKANIFTKFLIRNTRNWSLVHEILKDGNSRRIFYFMNINFAFMFIQMVYGYLTGSLGLISDSIHMLFDCVALLVGLCAVVLSNWPPSDQYPFGYGKLDQLAGLGNGVFLLLVTVEIFYGAFERLAENRSLERVNDLLVVSILGLLVNIYGMLAFDHGHDHGHGHDHHHHDSDNMRGIYLHILGDALGSVGVVASTVLVRYTGWNGWDPIASCIIAIIIGMHALPLVKRTAQSLLMALPDDVEYSLRNSLAGVSGLRGVVGYSTPKFWLAPGTENEHGDHRHDHHDDHSHHDSHQHYHTHDSPSHLHDHHGHDHHEDQHDHTHSHSHPSPPTHSPKPEKARILGVIHVVVSRTADLEQVRHKAADYFRERNMDIVVQVEREGDARCWCGGRPKPL